MPSINIVQKFFPKVERVVDAHRNAAIEVTAKDSSSKAVRDHNACAMAVACKRKFHLDGVIISRSVAYLIKGTQARRFMLPDSVSREVVSFDRGGGGSLPANTNCPPCLQRTDRAHGRRAPKTRPSATESRSASGT